MFLVLLTDDKNYVYRRLLFTKHPTANLLPSWLQRPSPLLQNRQNTASLRDNASSKYWFSIHTSNMPTSWAPTIHVCVYSPPKSYTIIHNMSTYSLTKATRCCFFIAFHCLIQQCLWTVHYSIEGKCHRKCKASSVTNSVLIYYQELAAC